MTEPDAPDIGGPEGGPTASGAPVLPAWVPPLPPEFQLTDREIIIAEIAAFKNAAILRRVIHAVAVVAVIVIAGGVTGWTVVRQESVHRINDIQDSRVQSLTESCVATNERNLDTNTKLDSLTPGRPTGKQRQGIQSSKLLIAALVPFTGDPESRDHGESACKNAALKRIRP